MSNAPPPAGPRRPLLRAAVQWFDTLFVLVLCLLTLMTTMLLRGKVLAGDGSPSDASAGGLDYKIVPWKVALATACLAAYVVYLLWHSHRELGEMVEHVYGPDVTSPGTGAHAPQPRSAEELVEEEALR